MPMLQARAGLERAGASRANAFTPNLVVTIRGVDRTASVDLVRRPARVEQTINDEPDQAFLTIVPSATFVPAIGDPIVFGLGTAENKEFAGQILRIRHERAKVASGAITWMHLEC